MANYRSITGLITEPIAGSHHKIPSVSTANLPGAGVNANVPAVDGMIVYNTTLGMLQQRSSGIWSGITTAPVITSFVYSDGASATAEKTVVGLVSVSCTTQTSTTVLVPGASLGIDVGMVVAGTGIPVGATVVSIIEDTSFVISAAATASATVTLTFGGAVTITGTNFDSLLAGGSANIGVTFDGTSATSISVNALKTIITCTPPAHAAGTITMLLTNASGLTASTNFVYDIEPIFTTAAGSIGSFVDGDFTGTPDGTFPRIQGTEDGVALTTGFQRVTSAIDNTVITTAIGGLTLQTTGYWTGTLSATEGTTYPFYATAKDSQNQRTSPRLFNIISKFADPTGGTISTVLGTHKMHVFSFAQTGTNFNSGGKTTIDVLVVAGGGCGGSSTYAGAGGAGGLLYFASSTVVLNTNYLVTVGEGGQTQGADGGDSTFAGLTTCNGGGGGGAYGGGLNGYNNGKTGGSGGGAGMGSWAGGGGSGGAASPAGQGNIGGGGLGSGGQSRGGGGGGKGGAASTSPGAYVGGTGWNGSSYFGTGVGDSGWFASGGGGSWGDGITTNGGVNTSPIGGGGNGGTQGGGSSNAAQAGQDGTGGGGGCGAASGGQSGQDGGDGVVIIRYPT
jgi:hypothetical protein